MPGAERRPILNCKFMYIRAMWFSRSLPSVGASALVLALTACALPSPRSSSVAPTGSESHPNVQGAQLWQPSEMAQWREVRFPGKSQTQYQVVRDQGQAWLRADAQRSASLLSQALDIDVGQQGRIRFAWRIEALLREADVARRDKEDSPARLILAFDGNRSEFSAQDWALSELSQLMTGEPMPYATLMYVWCPTRAVDTVVHNPRTDRIRKIVVANPQNASDARAIERDIAADYERAFGRPPGRLVGIAIMTDSDNTQGRARTLYGPIQIW